MAPFERSGTMAAVDAEELHRWTAAIVGRVGTPEDIAADVADVLVAADLRGVASHGTFRLPVYASLAEAGVIATSARPVRDGGTAVLRRWDAGDGWGPHAGRVLMDDAIERSGDLGLAGSIAHRASHFGIAGWYAMRASARGLIGITLTNASPLVAPTRSRQRLLGTNPIAVAAPAGRHGTFVLDMATSAVTWGRVLVADRRGTDLIPGVAIDGDGNPSTDPLEVLRTGALLPLGGTEPTAGYKGYGLAMMVDVLTGVLAGASFGSRVVPFSTTLGPSNLGQLFLAIDPAAIGDDAFVPRMEALCEELVAAPLAPDAPGPVLIPGQPEAELEAEQRRTGIRLDARHLEALVGLGDRLGMAFPRPLPGGSATPPARPATAPPGDLAAP
jgi:LDH2 family malate/lactate/ureidoglycolate dehydrogenase